MTPAGMLQDASGVVMAVGGVGLTASALVDATKVFRGGGASRFGFGHIRTAMKPFEPSLAACGIAWEAATLARWINGEPKADQSRALKDMIRIGVTPAGLTPAGVLGAPEAACVKAVAKACRLDDAALTDLVAAIAGPGPLIDPQKKLLARLDEILSIEIDAAFERADQQYRNASKVLAGAVAVGLAVWGGLLLAPAGLGAGAYIRFYLPVSVLFGLAAVPLAPVAKDLASALKAGADSLKPAKAPAKDPA